MARVPRGVSVTDEFDDPKAVYLHQIRLLERERDQLKTDVESALVARNSWTKRAYKAWAEVKALRSELRNTRLAMDRIQEENDMLAQEIKGLVVGP